MANPTMTVHDPDEPYEITFHTWNGSFQLVQREIEVIKRFGADTILIQELGAISTNFICRSVFYAATEAAIDQHIISVSEAKGIRTTTTIDSIIYEPYYIIDVSHQKNTGYFSFGGTTYNYMVTYSLTFVGDNNIAGFEEE